MNKGERQIFRVENLNTIEKGDVLSVKKDGQTHAEIEVLKINKTRTKILVRALGDVFKVEAGLKYNLEPFEYKAIDGKKGFEKKHFGHVFFLENTTKSFDYFQELSDGNSASGKLNLVKTYFGLGYEHYVSILDGLFHVGGAATFELPKEVDYQYLSYARPVDNDGTNVGAIGGKSNMEVDYVFSLYGNISLNIQDTFDLSAGLNFSMMETNFTSHSSVGYQAGIAAMKSHIRLGGIYRVNVYEGNVGSMKEKIVANDLIVTIGYVF